VATLVESQWLQSLWRDAKRWRSVPLGPIGFTFKFVRRHRSAFSSLLGKRLFRVRNGQSDSLAQKSKQNDISIVGRHAALKDSTRGSAVLVGVGPGLGEALASVLAEKGMQLALISRSGPMDLARKLQATNPKVAAYQCDATDERSVVKVMRDVEAKFGVPDILIYAVQAFARGSILTTEAVEFEGCWRANCLGAFIVSQQAARAMQPLGRGTIILAGATSSSIGRQGYLNLAVGKFGLRALAQVMARELGPQGIHVTHVVIDGDIAEDPEPSDDPEILPRHLAELFWSLHTQPRSCWTSELDVRPAGERFWEHC
jgi:NAD(P)-dependent dehydrogenase (short-subunit alcohol dehydrogenase family)